MLTELYRIEERHWWHAGMRRITHTLLAAEAVPPGPLLEIGSGGGTLWRELCARHPRRLVLGTDLKREGLLRQAAHAPPALFQADLHHLPLPDRTCAAILALDAFDQEAVDLARALAESWRVLAPGGILLLRVSAHPWLYGPHDRAFGTGRRFRAHPLRAALAAAGFRLRRMTFANTLLFPPAILLRLLQRAGRVSVATELRALQPLNPLLLATLNLERHWLRRGDLPAGLSLYALARKIDL